MASRESYREGVSIAWGLCVHQIPGLGNNTPACQQEDLSPGDCLPRVSG